MGRQPVARRVGQAAGDDPPDCRRGTHSRRPRRRSESLRDCSIATGADSKIARQEQGESTWDPLNASELAPNSANGLIPSLIAWAKSQSPGNIAIVSAHAAFQRDLPLLIKNHRHRWVAYHGDRRVAIGPSERQLFQQCHHQDLPPEEFMVRLIEAEIPEEIDWNESHDV